MKTIHQLIAYSFISFLTIHAAIAQERFVNALSGAQIVNNAVFTVSDDKFASLPLAGAVNKLVECRVILEIDEDALVAKTTSNVTVAISVKAWSAPTPLPDITETKSLNLNFNGTSAGTTPHRAFSIWANYHKLEITITGVTYSPSPIPPLKLIGEILVDRKLAFSTATAPVPNNVTPSSSAANFTWPSTAGAEEYDLEWAFFDSESGLAKTKLALSVPLTQTEVNDIFRFNATRVSTANLQYTLPLAYPMGYILYRLRAARINSDGRREFTGWSSYKSFAISTHEPGLHWQAQTTFAEEGKLVPSISYFDNTLRERQMVTLSNSIGMTLASATAYDHQGRPAFKTLTAPTFQTFLKFDPLLAANAAGSAAYGKTEFDISTCNYAAPAISSAFGVGKYFSPNNPNYLSDEHRFIPDAKGFPYSITEYTADQTGRIRRQSGPGEMFRMTGGKESRYFYGKASQDELDRLFGNDAGDASHYQKNMVVDPNGQASVSYIDMHGRTVATALAGPSPTNVNPLPNSTTIPNFRRDLLQNINTEYSVTSNFTLLVPHPGQYTFEYLLSNSPVLNDLACSPGICYDCAYDLRIQILPSCGGTPLVDIVVPNFTQVAEDDNVCGAALAIYALSNPNQVINLPVGEYIVTKTLSINQEALNTYLNIFLAQPNCIPNLPNLKTQFRALANTDGCDIVDCQACKDELMANPNGYTPEEIQVLMKECEERCGNSTNWCEVTKLLLESDVHPGGQYAQYSYNQAQDKIESTDPTSIFYLDGTLYKYQQLNPGDNYLDENGASDSVKIDGALIAPQNLTPKQFLENWKPSWASTLIIKHHPEYCQYLWCTGQTGTSQFETNILATDTYAEAVTKGWINNGETDFFNDDPYFLTTEGMACKTDLQARWNDLNLGQSGTLSVKDFVKQQIFGACSPIPDMGAVGTASADNDAAWRMFRAIYLGLVAQCKGAGRSQNFCNPAGQALINCIGNPSCAGGPYAAYVNKERKISNEDYRSQMNDPNFYSTSESTELQNSKTECENFCTDNAEIWLIELSKACSAIANLTQLDKDNLKLRLAAVCKAACDVNHPYGATSTPPGVFTSYNDSSFEQILDVYTGAGQNLCGNCHANVISFPGTYLVPAYTSARRVESRINTCACENYQNLKACYLTLPNGTYPSFADYLKQFSEVPLTALEMATLEAGCASTARNLTQAITLPPYLECSVCKTCEEITSLVNTFPISCTNSDPNYYTYLARFLNSKLGLNRSGEEYKAFMDQCSATPPPNVCQTLMICPAEISPIADPTADCVQIVLDQADQQAEIAYNEALRTARSNFITQYLNKCLTGLNEQFYSRSDFLEYQYTLYYYDQSNLLTQTIAPAGVNPLDLYPVGQSPSNRDKITAHRMNPTLNPPLYPAHTFPTRYAYNTLGGTVKQIAPDLSLENRYFYDRVGRLVASQDGRQRPTNKYSYTLYDELGRVVQTGEGVNNTLPPTIFTDALAFNSWFAGLGSKAHVTRTYYDDIPQSIFTGLPSTFTRDNLRSRVATSTIAATYNPNDDLYDYATHYNYDITGDVATVLQDMPELAANGHRYKRIDYDYDQLSGKVNAVFYQKGQADQFSYRYFYDLDNRLTQVMSSFTDTEPFGALWDREASYKYYQHGPLARTEIGHYRVQGMDYAYTLQGWIKGLNASFLNPGRDMGRDAQNVSTNPNRYTAADVFAYTLGFYNAINGQSSSFINDYYAIAGTSGQFEVIYPTSSDVPPFHTDAPSQFTGNIRFIAKQTRDITPNGASIQTYRYDQLMRLNAMNTYFPGATALSSWNVRATGFTAPLQSNYKEASISYDRNGNILTYQRWGASASIQDNLTYTLVPGGGTNKLSHVADAVTAGSFATDFDGQSANNYTYDEAGNLTGDAQSSISAGGITWSPYGKVLQVNISGGVTQNIFAYDAMQNRIKKRKVASGSDISTFYIRDAQGNVLAVYEKNGTTITWKEQHLYGSSRLGTVEPGVAWTTTPVATPHFRGTRILNYGWKRYEINDHLGNVRTLINDRKGYLNSVFQPTTIQATDYFPFGSEMRKGTGAIAYRYGFNGKELDKSGEFGSLNHYDYGFRIYNPAIGRFLSVDPLTGDYPELTPYQFASNTPIMAIDLDGLEAMVITYNHLPNKAKPVITWRLDMKKRNIDQIYSYHKYWNTKGRLMAMTSGTESYSDHQRMFPTLGGMKNKPLVTTEIGAQLISGEFAFGGHAWGVVPFAIEGGLEVVNAEFSYQSDRKNKFGDPAALKFGFVDPDEIEFKIGGGASVGLVGKEFRKKYTPSTGEWGENSIEVDQGFFDDDPNKAPGKGFWSRARQLPWGMKIEFDPEIRSTSIKFGVPEFKVAFSAGIKAAGVMSINFPIPKSATERSLEKAIEEVRRTKINSQ